MPLLGRQQLQEAFERRVDQMFVALVLEGTGRLIRRTPVLTGRARNNWNVGIDSVDMSTKAAGTGFDKSGGDAIQKGQQVAMQLKAGNVAYITNALPYIKSLNEGSSSQMPAGWIELTMAELDVIAGQITDKLGP